MAGIIDLNASRAITETTDGDIAVYDINDVRELEDGSHEIVTGAEPIELLNTDTQLSESDVVSSLDGKDVGADTPLSSLQSEEINNTLFADTGNLQTTLGNAVPGDTVVMHPSKTYDPGSETTVPKHVTLDFNGAEIAPTTDYPVLFVDHGAEVRNADIQIHNAQTFTSACVTLDTVRAGGGYTTAYNGDGQGTAASVGGRISGGSNENNSATGLLLTGEDTGISLGNIMDLTLRQLDVGFHADVVENTSSVGFVQGPQIRLITDGCRIHIDQSVGCNFQNEIYGAAQCKGTTEAVLRNQGTKVGPTYHGNIWDSQVASGNIIQGPNISVVSSTAFALDGKTDGSDGQIGYNFGSGSLEIIDYGTGTTRNIQPSESIGMAVDKNSVADLTEYTGHRVSVAGSTVHSIFSGLAEPVNVLNGFIYGSHARDITVTWGDGTQSLVYEANTQGQDEAGGYASPTPIPQLRDVTGLAFRNVAGSARDYGYKVLTK